MVNRRSASVFCARVPFQLTDQPGAPFHDLVLDAEDLLALVGLDGETGQRQVTAALLIDRQDPHLEVHARLQRTSSEAPKMPVKSLKTLPE